MAFYVSDTKLKVFERKYFKILVLKFKIKPKGVGVSRAEFLYNSNSSRSKHHIIVFQRNAMLCDCLYNLQNIYMPLGITIARFLFLEALNKFC